MIKYFFGLISILLIVIAIFYTPEWKRKGMTGTLSYDVAGYYMYLPAGFIYQDLKNYSFQDTLTSKEIDVGIYHGRWQDNGGYVFQYTCGMALQYLPSFLVAHSWASFSENYPNNGFSFPYQFCVFFGSIFIALIGLYFSLKILNLYFSPLASGLSVLAIFLGSNYLVYAGVKSAMSHNYLFTLNALILYQVIKFYEQPNRKLALGIGLALGLAILVRPTEALTVIIAFGWGVNILSWSAIKSRVQFIQNEIGLYLVALISVVAVGLIQIFYWYYVSGSPLVYSYGDQGFDWLKPHIRECLISARSGWLTYSPIMIFALMGFWFLNRQKKSIGWTISLYTILFMYVTFSWNIWWYGGSLGQRAMVQSYVFLAFPMAAFWEWLIMRRWFLRAMVFAASLGFIYLNLWYTHMAIKGPVFFTPPQVTGKYFKKTVGTWKMNTDNLKYLDTSEEFKGTPTTKQLLLEKNYTSDSIFVDNSQNNSFEIYKSQKPKGDKNHWIEVEVEVESLSKEWTWWKYNQLIVQFFDQNDQSVKHNIIRLERHLEPNQKQSISFDTQFPENEFDYFKIYILNLDSPHPLLLHNAQITLLTGQ